MRKPIDLTGQTFGRYRVLSREKPDGNKGVVWLCECECGIQKKVLSWWLRKGLVRSCGCLQKEEAKKKHTTHGEYQTRLYRIFYGIHQRCRDVSQRGYKNYGGRGISVCEEWNSYEPFRDWAIKNGYSDDLTIERIDVNGNYEPKNCTWIPLSEQWKNTRRSLKFGKEAMV